MLIRTIEPKSLYNCVRQKSGVIFFHGFFNVNSGATTEFRFLPRKKIRGKKKIHVRPSERFRESKNGRFFEQENVYKLDS